MSSSQWKAPTKSEEKNFFLDMKNALYSDCLTLIKSNKSENKEKNRTLTFFYAQVNAIYSDAQLTDREAYAQLEFVLNLFSRFIKTIDYYKSLIFDPASNQIKKEFKDMEAMIYFETNAYNDYARVIYKSGKTADDLLKEVEEILQIYYEDIYNCHVVFAVRKYIIATDWDAHWYQHTKEISICPNKPKKTVPAKVGLMWNVITDAEDKNLKFQQKRELIHKIAKKGEHQYQLFSHSNRQAHYHVLSELTATPAINIERGYYYHQLEKELDQTFGEMLGKKYTPMYA